MNVEMARSQMIDQQIRTAGQQPGIARVAGHQGRGFVECPDLVKLYVGYVHVCLPEITSSSIINGRAPVQSSFGGF